MEVYLPNLKTALNEQVNKNDVIANNLANINTNGFKKDFLFFETLQQKVKDKGKDDGVRHATYFEQGPLKKTENPLDIALNGKGFFTVETELGEAYTRNGHFKLRENGEIYTAAGHLLSGYGGTLNVLVEGALPKEIVITKDGEIYANGQYIDQLRIVDFDDHSILTKKGNNLFTAQNGALPEDVEKPFIQQGYLEGSNINPAQEMISLIEVQRQFESVQKMVQTMDRIFSDAVTKIGSYT
jgi:flagellar basal-body rod protein FlgG